MIAPKGLEATSQSIFAGVYLGMGALVGSIIGGKEINFYSENSD